MDSSISSHLSRRTVASIRQTPLRFQQLSRQNRSGYLWRIHPHIHHAHSSSKAARPNNTIVLEQPDKFRPPSHPQRLNARRTTAPLMGGYNQGISEAERQTQKTRSYPHMFPREGTVMYRFLTNKMIHVWISLGVLTTLAIFTLFTSFVKTSPFAHLLPPLSTLPFHPINYIKEYLSVVRMHIDYTTEQTAQKRQRAILDAQKRRLYRRAHGMEDLDAKEDTGVDVRGIASWDDGLTNAERAKGGRKTGMMSGQQILEAAGPAALEEAQRRKEEVDRGQRKNVGSLEDIMKAANISAAGAGIDVDGIEDVVPEDRPRKKVKRWLGIWE